MISNLIQRREFLELFALSFFPAACRAAGVQPAARQQGVKQGRFFFTSQGKTGMMNADGTGLRYLDFDVPNQASVQPVDFFADGRVILLSLEKVNPNGRSFSEYYHKTPTHIWIYHLENGSYTEILKEQRIAPFYAPCAIVPGEQRMIVQVILLNGQATLYSMDLDGTHQQQITRPEEGFPYGLSLSPDGKRMAFHSAGNPTYRVFCCNIDGSGRVLVAGDPDHLYFGTSWSPDGKWILYQDCAYKTDKGHDWSDICIGNPDGSENRVLTTGHSQWFAAAYGDSQHHGDGSNVPQWAPDGRILYTRKLPGSQPAWQFQPQRPDTDHFNRDYKPEQARGGTEICLLNPKDGSVTRLTHNDPPQWDFRARSAPSGNRILFCRARAGGLPAIWIMDSDGKNQRLLTRGLDNQGADFPRWLPR